MKRGPMLSDNRKETVLPDEEETTTFKPPITETW